MTNNKSLRRRRIGKLALSVSALGLITAVCGQLSTLSLYHSDLAELIAQCNESDGKLAITYRQISSGWFKDEAELHFKVNDESGSYEGSFILKTSVFPFFVESELVPDTDSIKDFFEEKNLENIKLRTGIFGNRLSVKSTNKRVPLPAFLFEQCGAEKLRFELDADLYKKLPFGKLPVSFTADSLSCYAKGVFGEQQSLYLQDFSLTTTLDRLFTADGLSTPVFAKVKARKSQFRFGQNDFIFKDVTVNHELINSDKEGLYFNFSVGEGSDFSSVTLKGTNDRTDDKKNLKGRKHGEYKITLLGNLFNNRNNSLMVELVRDGYLKVNDKKLESDVTLDAFFNEFQEPSFKLTVNGKKVDTRELAKAMLYPSIKGSETARRRSGLPNDAPEIR